MAITPKKTMLRYLNMMKMPAPDFRHVPSSFKEDPYDKRFRHVADITAPGGYWPVSDRPDDVSEALRSHSKIRPRLSAHSLPSGDLRLDYEKPVVRDLRHQRFPSFDSPEPIASHPQRVTAFYHPGYKEFIIEVEQYPSVQRIFGFHNIGRWVYDELLRSNIRRMLQEGVLSHASLAEVWLGCRLQERLVEDYICRLYSTHYGSSALPAKPAGSITPSKRTTRAPRIATRRLRRLQKLMEVPTVITSGVRK